MIVKESQTGREAYSYMFVPYITGSSSEQGCTRLVGLSTQRSARIAAEVDVAMDNSVHINPLLRQVYGERSSEAQGQERGE